MVKILKAPRAKKAEKTRVSVRVPQPMIADIDERLAQLNMSKRHRSKWICDSILQLAQLESNEDIIHEEWIEAGGNFVMQITLDEHSLACLSKLVANIQQKSHKQDVQSSIIRTAILQALISPAQHA